MGEGKKRKIRRRKQIKYAPAATQEKNSLMERKRFGGGEKKNGANYEFIHGLSIAKKKFNLISFFMFSFFLCSPFFISKKKKKTGRNENVISRHYAQLHYRKSLLQLCWYLRRPLPPDCLNWDLKNEEGKFAFAFLFRLLHAHCGKFDFFSPFFIHPKSETRKGG